MSHSYKIVSVTDQSENYKITNVESKNPATCWRTSKVCEQASFDIKFAPIKLHHIDIITQFSPQIEIKAYNKGDLGGIIDETQVLPRVTIFNYKEVLEGQMPTKTKKYDFYDKPFLVNFLYQAMLMFPLLAGYQVYTYEDHSFQPTTPRKGNVFRLKLIHSLFSY